MPPPMHRRRSSSPDEARPLPARRPAGRHRRRAAPALAWVNIQTAAGRDRRATSHVRFWARRASHLPCRGGPGSCSPPTGRTSLSRRPREGSRHARPDDQRVSRRWPRSPTPNPRTIINDGEVVPGGKAVVFGTKDMQFEDPIANLYLFTVDDNRVSVLADRQTCSNGKVFAPRRARPDPLRHRHADEEGRPLPARRRGAGPRRPDGVAVDVSRPASASRTACATAATARSSSPSTTRTR